MRQRFFSFVLVPGLARDMEEEAQTVLIEAEADEIELNLVLNIAEEYDSFEASLKSAEGNVLCSGTGLAASRMDQGECIRWSLPAAIFQARDLAVEVFGTAGDVSEFIDHYYFRVSRVEEPGTGSSQ